MNDWNGHFFLDALQARRDQRKFYRKKKLHECHKKNLKLLMEWLA